LAEEEAPEEIRKYGTGSSLSVARRTAEIRREKGEERADEFSSMHLRAFT